MYLCIGNGCFGIIRIGGIFSGIGFVFGTESGLNDDSDDDDGEPAQCGEQCRPEHWGGKAGRDVVSQRVAIRPDGAEAAEQNADDGGERQFAVFAQQP